MAKGDVTVVYADGSVVLHTNVSAVYVMQRAKGLFGSSMVLREEFLAIARDGPGARLYLAEGYRSVLVHSEET